MGITEAPMAVAAPRHDDALDALRFYPVTRGTPITVLRDGRSYSFQVRIDPAAGGAAKEPDMTPTLSDDDIEAMLGEFGEPMA